MHLSILLVVCVPITLNHAFGFGSGALAAWVSGATLVLPTSPVTADTTIQVMHIVVIADVILISYLRRW